MKKYLVTVLAFAGLISCNKVENIGNQQNTAIAFADSFVEIKTRAAEDPSITTESIDAFDVWAYMDNPLAVILQAERVSKQSDNTWSYENLQYWTPNHTYYFSAIAPVDDENIVVDASKADENGLGTVSFTNVDGTTDLLYANKVVTTGSDVVNNDPGKVHLQFAHQLAKVKFTFTNGFTNENTKVVVKDIKMLVPSKGIVTLASREWWVESTSALELDFGDVEDAVKLDITESGESDYERLTIPCDENRAYKITFTVELYHGTYEKPAYSADKEITLTGQAFKIGKNYNLKATINAENLDLLPIEFDVIEVEEWVEDTAKELKF